MAEIKLIDKLTPEQEAKFPEFREKWIGISENTDRIDKEESRQAVMECYDLAREKLPRPEYVVFVESPFQLFYTKPIWNRIADHFQKRNQEMYSDTYDGVKQPEGALWYNYQPEDQTEQWRVHAIATIFDAIIDEIKDTVPRLDFRGDERAFYRSLGLLQQEWLKDFPETIRTLKNEAEKELGAEIYGQNETWLCFYEFMEWAGCEGLEGTHGLQRLAKNAGWWIPYDTLAVVADRPTSLHVDDQGRLHSTNSPAIEFVDGWKYYASHGMQIPSWIIEQPEKITVSAIENEENVEIRRVMLEIFGLDNYLKQVDAELIDRDDDPHVGVLWRKPIQDDEDIYMLEMRNSTPEADGTWKTYVIRVPPSVRTAQQANAWSYGFSNPEEYKPVLQS